MSLICITMAFVLDLNDKDGSVYLEGSLLFIVVDIILTGLILGFLYG